MTSRLAITAATAHCGLSPTLLAAWPRLLAGVSAVREAAPPHLDGWPGRWFAAGIYHPESSDAAFAPHLFLADLLLQYDFAGLDRVGLCFGASKGVLSSDGERVAMPHPEFVCDRIRGLAPALEPVSCPVAACATGLVAVVDAARWLERGRCQAVLAGAADYSFNALVMASYRRAGVLSSWPGEAAAAGRPFDAARCGFVLGEGCGLLVLEPEGSAARHGREPLAILSGHAVHSDPTDLVAPDPSGRPVAETVRRAIASAGLTPRDVDAVCCHGTGTRRNDAAEARGLRAAFGADLDRVSCFSLKGAIGHTLGASGAVELAFCVEAVRSQTVPPHLNCDDLADDCPIPKPSPVPVEREIRHLLKLSFGFGGPVAAVVVSRP